MVIPDKRTRLINEFCKKGHLDAYKDVITQLLDIIHADGASVSIWDNVSFSKLEPNGEDRPYHIRIGVKGLKTPLNIIWNLLHEFGHYQDWPKKEGDGWLERENNAWDLAERRLSNYPELETEKKMFYAHKQWRLETYYKKYGKPGVTGTRKEPLS